MNKVLHNDQGEVRNGWKLLGFLVLTMAVSAVFGLALRPAFPFFRSHPALIPMPFVSGLIMLLPTAICLRAERATLANAGLAWDRRWAREALLGTALGLGLMVVTALVIRAMGGFHWELNPATTLRTLLAGAWLYIGVALFEELTFRGYAFQRLVRGVGVWPAQFLLAAFFAYAHWHNPGMSGATKLWASLNIGLAAILLGLAYLKTGSLALPMGIHLGWNWTQGNLLGFGVSGTTDTQAFIKPVFQGRPEWLTGGAFGLEASLPCLLVVGACCLWLMRWQDPEARAAMGSAS
jgi:hypothetical protein